MAWTNWPVTITTDIQKWAFYFEALTAVRERMFASGLASYPSFPRTNIIWDSATVTAITATTVTLDKTPAYADDYWITRVAPAPTIYDVVIDNADPTKVIRSRITDNTGNVLTVNDMSDYPTSKFISSLSDVVGQKAYIIRAGGLWWSERIIQWPNDLEFDRGTSTSSTPSSVTDSSKGWTPGQWTGYNLMIFGSSFLRRITITGNTADTLQFATQSFTPSGEYMIVQANKKCDVLRDSGFQLAWYGHSSQAEDTAYSHRPTDAIGVTVHPATTVDVDGTPVDCFDTDVWSLKNEVTSGGDDCYTPNLYKSYRQLQVELERLCDYFVEEKTYDNSTAIELFTKATAFYKAGINAYTKTATAASDDVTFTLNALPYTGVQISYAILDDLGNRVMWGDENPGSTTFTKTVGAQYNGKTMTLYVSYGWTRWFPKAIRHMYDKIYFVPDTDEDGVIIPPTNTDPGAGTWVVQTKDTNYIDMSEQGKVLTGSVAYTNGDVARYDGDNFNDPTLDGVADELLDWEDAAFEGTYDPTHQGTYEASLSGIAASGGNNYLKAKDKDWYNVYPMSGVIRTETGTASGGTGTTLTDSSKSGNFFWDTARGRWNGFILEVTDVSAGVTYKTPITGTSGTTLTFTAVTGLDVDPGDTYQIREPKSIKNRFAGRKLEITKQDGTVHTVDILYNDDDTLWFATQAWAVEEDDTFRIIEFRTGSVLKRVAGAWEIATGTDPRGEDFVTYTNGNLPHNIKRYGRLHKGDYFSYHIYDELYRLINVLVWTRGNPTWRSRYDTAVAEKNARDTALSVGNAITQEIPETSLSDAKTLATTGWSDGYRGPASGDTHEQSSTPPYAYSLLTWEDFEWDDGGTIIHEDNYGASAARAYAYGVLTGIPICQMTRTVDWYAWAEVDASNSDETTSDPYKFDFDTHGDDVIYRHFSLWSSTSPADTTGDTVSGVLGSRDTMPSWASDPSDAYPTYTSTSSRKGYYVTRQYCVIKWNVSGGFQKYD